MMKPSIDKMSRFADGVAGDAWTCLAPAKGKGVDGEEKINSACQQIYDERLTACNIRPRYLVEARPFPFACIT